MTAAPEVGTTTFRRAERVLTRRSADRVILLTPPGRDLLELRGTGLALWEVLASPRSSDDVASVLSRLFDVDPDTARRDIEPVLDELVEHGALERCEPPR